VNAARVLSVCALVVAVTAPTCLHPWESTFNDGPYLLCGICGDVLETYTTEEGWKPV
jgi:hypothetical protein